MNESSAFFQYLYILYQLAERAAGESQDFFFSVGERQVHMHFAGPGLLKSLTPALSHLEIPLAGKPNLTIYLWDSVSTGTKLPLMLKHYLDKLGEWWLYLGKRGEIKELMTERIHASYHLGPNILSVIDLKTNVALYWLMDAGEIPYYEIGSPLKTILNWWANKYDCQFVHAGAIGQPDGGVLLAGKGGSGKSTTSLACLEAGMLYASDDYCLVKSEPEPYVYSIYNTAKLRGDLDLERFPKMAPLISNKSRLEDEKAMLFLHEHFTEKVSRGFPIKAILVPVITPEKETRLKPASAGAVLSALAPSTLIQLPGAGNSAIKFMSKLVSRVPGYVLELGSDVSKISPVIFRLLSESK